VTRGNTHVCVCLSLDCVTCRIEYRWLSSFFNTNVLLCDKTYKTINDCRLEYIRVWKKMILHMTCGLQMTVIFLGHQCTTVWHDVYDYKRLSSIVHSCWKKKEIILHMMHIIYRWLSSFFNMSVLIYDMTKMIMNDCHLLYIRVEKKIIWDMTYRI